jgi:hypothetical protein
MLCSVFAFRCLSVRWQAAEAVMAAIVACLDPVALLQPVCRCVVSRDLSPSTITRAPSAIEYGNPRSRGYMLHTLQVRLCCISVAFAPPALTLTLGQGFILRAHRSKPQLLFKVRPPNHQSSRVGLHPTASCRMSRVAQFAIPVLCKLLEEHKGEVKTATTQVMYSITL